jgi:hypothetical protein
MKYIISGIALCPVKVRVEVEAENEGEAIKLAVKKAHANRADHVVVNSEDPTSWELTPRVRHAASDMSTQKEPSSALALGDCSTENPPLREGDKFQVGVMLTNGEIVWGTIQTVKRMSDMGPCYRPPFAKVDKYARHWRLPSVKDQPRG